MNTFRKTPVSSKNWTSDPVPATLGLYALAAVAEIAGCFAFWAWLRLGRSALWLVPGVAALILFAWLLTRIEADFAGRAYAAYGGVYVAASIGWLWATEGQMPTRLDLLGAGLCIAGTLMIVAGARA
ncbi:YnfA family protein [Paracoccus nototheniae]